MALMPGAQWRPLGPDPQREGTLAATIVCLHTMVGSLLGTDNYFKQNGYGGTESHFGTGHDGTIFQWQDTRYRADANLDGNDRVISIENADTGPGFPAWSGSNVPAFTPAQIEANAKILAWCHKVHGIRLVLIPNSAQSSAGVGYHRQGCDPWRCATCEQWGGRGKVCPGDRRVAQIPQIIARANALVAGTQPPEDDVAVDDVRIGLHQMADEAANRSTPTGRQYGDDLHAIITRAVKAALDERFPPEEPLPPSEPTT